MSKNFPLSSHATEDLPFQGAYYRCKDKKFVETVVFIPFYGGTQKNLFHHIQFVNDLGFDAVGFDLYFFKRNLRNLLFKRSLFFIWRKQIQTFFDHLPEDKILFSFSNPILATLPAFREKDHIRAWICDSGPSGKFFQSCLNYLTHHDPIQSKWKRFLWAFLFYFFFMGFKNQQKVWEKHLQSLNQTLPLLVIKGQQDPLIPPDHVDAHFNSLESYFRLDQLLLSKASHLDGLKVEPKQYQDKVSAFLKQYARPLTH